MVTEPDKRASLVDIDAHLDAALVLAIPVQQELQVVRILDEGLTIALQERSTISRGERTRLRQLWNDFRMRRDIGWRPGGRTARRQGGLQQRGWKTRIKGLSTSSSVHHRHELGCCASKITPTWNENGLLALMKWINGNPLFNLIGLLELYAEDLSEPDSAALVEAMGAQSLRGA